MGHIELIGKRIPGESMGDFYERLRKEAETVTFIAEMRKVGQIRLKKSPEFIEHPADDTLTIRWPYSKT